MIDFGWRPPGKSGQGKEREVQRLGMVCLAALILLVFGAGAAGCAPVADDAPELILLGEVLIDPDRPVVEAIAIAGGRVVSFGTRREIVASSGPVTRVVDLGSAFVAPSFKDHHIHLLNLGLAQLNRASEESLFLELGGLTQKEIVEKVRQRAAELPHGAWILGQSWSQGAWGEQSLPDHRPLTEAAPNHPVFLTRVDAHAGWANASALQIAGIRPGLSDPQGGAIVRDGRSVPTGVLLERANELVTRHLPPLALEQVRAAFRAATDTLASQGMTHVYDAGFLAAPGIVDLNLDGETLLQGLQSEQEAAPFPIKISLMIPAPSEMAEKAIALPDFRRVTRNTWITHLKLFADGAMGSRGASLSHPFADDPSTSGVERLSEAQIYDLARRALTSDLDVATHAIGDLAVEKTLNAYERLIADLPEIHPERLRIEHFSYASLADMERAARMGIVLSIQPLFVGPDSSGRTMEDSRVGDVNGGRVYAWNRLSQLGARLALGTDYFTAPGPPLLNFYSASWRGSPQLDASVAWNPQERLSPQQALQLATGWFASGGYSSRANLLQEEPANLIILSSDPRTAAAGEVLAIDVHSTMLEGRVTFSDGRFALIN